MLVERQSEALLQLTPAESRYAQGASVEVPAHPSLGKGVREEGGAERTTYMRAPFAPIDAAECEAPPLRSHGVDVDAMPLEREFARPSEGIGSAIAWPTREPS
jgi:hypothetical protein